jgi:hypothetical protein
MSSSKYIKNEQGFFVCPNCNIVKEKQNTMYYHMLKHEGKLPYECDICKKEFLQKTSLEVHKASKHKNPTTKEKMYKCCITNCSFEAVTKANRRIHVIRKHFKNEVDDILGEDNTCLSCKTEFQSSTAFFYHAINCIKTNSADMDKILESIS